MTKEIKMALFALLILVLVFLGVGWLNYANYQRSIIREIDRNLTQDERKIYDDRLAQADSELAKADLSTDQRFDWLMYKGFQLQGLGKFTSAMEIFAQAAEVKPDNPNVYVAMYNTQLEMQDNKGAQTSIRKAIELNPQSADIWKKYIILEQERFEAGTEQLKNLYLEALEKTNTHTDLVTAYAQFLESTGDLQAARDYWKKALETYPENHVLYEAEIKRLEDLMK